MASTSPGLPFELQPGEHVLLLARRHWIYLTLRLVRYLLAALIPVAIVSSIVAATDVFDGTIGWIVLLIELAWIVFWGIKAYFAWYTYMHDIWVVTNQRIIDGFKPNWFKSRLASADLVDVQDIAVEKNGVFATLFNYGDVRCQTAGEQPNFVLTAIPDPARALQIVDTARDAARRSGNSSALAR